MILSGKEIEKRMGTDIIIDPYDKRENLTETITIPPEGLLLESNKLYLGRTQEFTETQNLVPMLEGRSSVGRLGLFIHVTAGFGDVGFKGYWTLEIFCVQPVKIYAGVEVCQVYFHTIEGEHENYASGKYQNNSGIQPSLLYRDFEEKDGA
jgi:dCTP deaminase